MFKHTAYGYRLSPMRDHDGLEIPREHCGRDRVSTVPVPPVVTCDTSFNIASREGLGPMVLASLLQTAHRPLEVQGLQSFDDVYILELVTQFLRCGGHCSLTADNHVGQLTQ